MAQLQNLFTNIALGLRRLEAEEEAAQPDAEKPVNAAAERARKYSSPSERYGRIAILWYSADHLQLPPVPESSSILAHL